MRKLNLTTRILISLLLFMVAIGAVLGDIQEVHAANDRYWVGGTGSWHDTAHWSTSDGGGGGASVPNSTNDVHFTSNSDSGAPFSVSISTTANCGDFDCSGLDDNLVITGSAALNIYGSMTLDSLMVMSGYTGTVIFKATAGTETLTSDGITLYGSVVFNGVGGTFQLSDTLTLSGEADLTLTNGTFDDNGQTVVLRGDDQLISGAFTFTDLTLTNQDGDKNTKKTLDSDITVTGTFTATGDGEFDRLAVSSTNVTATQITITAATVVSTHTDYAAIVGAGAGDWDLSSAGEDSIGYFNNSGITFTYPYDANEDVYWTGLQDGVAGSGVWNGYTSGGFSDNDYNFSTTSGGSGGAPRHTAPGATNDVYIDGNSGIVVGSNSITGTYTITAKDIDFTGSDALTPPSLVISGTASGGKMYIYGSLTLVPDMTFKINSGTNTRRVEFKGTGTITSNGVTIDTPDGVYFDSTGLYTLADGLYSSSDFTYIGGGFDSNSKIIYLTSAGTFAGGSQSYYGLYMDGAGTCTITGINNFTYLTREGTASFTDALEFAANQYITNLDLQGYSNKYRLAFGSTVPGTQRQISVSGTVDVTNTNISDSAKVGAGDPDISAGDNSDYGGNLGWIFDTGYYVYWVGNSGNWSDNTNHWASSSGGTPGSMRVPLIQDIAVFDANSFTIEGRTLTIDITDLSGIDSSGVTNNPTFSKAGTVSIYGDVTLGTQTWNVTTTQFSGLDTSLASDSTLDTNFYVLKSSYFMSGLYLYSDVVVDGNVYVRSGVFNHNGYDLTADIYDSATTTYERQILLGSGATILQGVASGNKWNMNSTNLTLNSEESVIIMTNSGTNGQTFVGAGLVYNNFTMSGAGVWTLTMSGTNTFGTIAIDRNEANKTLTGSVTCTITDSGGLSLALSGTNTITITNTDFSMADGVVFGDYLVLSGSDAAGGGTFFASVGGHSTNNGGNTGWIWTPPTAPTIATLDATDVTYLGEQLNGELLTAGSYSVFYVYFEYGPTASYGFETTEETLNAPDTFDWYISPYKVYHYRAVVRFGLNDHAYGNDKTVSLSGAVGQAKAAVADPGQSSGTALVSSVPSAPGNMYTEGETGGLFGLDPLVNEALAVPGIPQAVFWYPIAFLVAIVLGFSAYGITKSLLAQCAVSAVVMAGFAMGGALGDGLLPYWTVLVFAIEAFLVVVIQEKQNV